MSGRPSRDKKHTERAALAIAGSRIGNTQLPLSLSFEIPDDEAETSATAISRNLNNAKERKKREAAIKAYLATVEVHVTDPLQPTDAPSPPHLASPPPNPPLPHPPTSSNSRLPSTFSSDAMPPPRTAFPNIAVHAVKPAKSSRPKRSKITVGRSAVPLALANMRSRAHVLAKSIHLGAKEGPLYSLFSWDLCAKAADADPEDVGVAVTIGNAFIAHYEQAFEPLNEVRASSLGDDIHDALAVKFITRGEFGVDTLLKTFEKLRQALKSDSRLEIVVNSFLRYIRLRLVRLHQINSSNLNIIFAWQDGTHVERGWW